MQYNFIYVGRLDAEKGIQDIIYACDRLLSEGIYMIRLDIFGQEGNCSQQIKDLVQKYPSSIQYHGRQSKAYISSYRAKAHYTLMPSHFLETFGLVCLDSYRHKTPVLGYVKGGLKELIYKDFVINASISGQQDIDLLYNKIIFVLQKFDNSVYLQQREHCFNIYMRYTSTVWKKNIVELFGKDINSIYMVSDYLHRFGGIESFIYEAGDTLCQELYSVQYFGSSYTTGFMRISGLFVSGCNTFLGIKLFITLLKSSPDIIRYHSVQRVLGWFPLWIASFFSCRKVFMLHDVGLLHPYPSLVTDEQQLQFSRKLSSYISAGVSVGKKSIFSKTAMTAKYMSASLIRIVLQKSCHLFLVPSLYLVSHLRHWLGSDQYPIQVLPHFVHDV